MTKELCINLPSLGVIHGKRWLEILLIIYAASQRVCVIVLETRATSIMNQKINHAEVGEITRDFMILTAVNFLISVAKYLCWHVPHSFRIIISFIFFLENVFMLIVLARKVFFI